MLRTLQMLIHLQLQPAWPQSFENMPVQYMLNAEVEATAAVIPSF